MAAQCPNNNSFYIDMTPASPGQTVTTGCVWGGDYVTVDVCLGAQYTFQTCGGGWDTELTVRNDAAPFAILAYNDDACGTQSQIVWTATLTGTVRVLVDEWSCSHNSSCQFLSVTWDTGCPSSGGPGDDCANAIPVNCSDALTGETTIGNGDTENNWNCYTPAPISTPGDDRYYVVSVTDPAATIIRITLDNVVDNDTFVEVIQAGLTCSGNNCDLVTQYNTNLARFPDSGVNSFDFPITGAGSHYFIIDSQSDGVTSYDISFECLASGIEWDTSGCAGPPADVDRNGYEVSWNGGVAGQVQHGDAGEICYDLFITNPNPAGWEWLQTVEIRLGDCWTNVNNITPDDPPGNNGWYNTPGDWSGTYNAGANTVEFDFVNSLNPLWGDGNIPNHTCAQYTFCFDAEVDTNLCPGANDADLEIVLFVEDDGVGGFGTTQPSSALQLSPEFFFDSSLPVALVDFDAYRKSDGIQLEWQTVSETNNSHFRIERSPDGLHFAQYARVEGAGNSTALRTYGLLDDAPLVGDNHYRLVQVDHDGAETPLGVRLVAIEAVPRMAVGRMAPHPVTGMGWVDLRSPVSGTAMLALSNALGEVLRVREAAVQPGANAVAVDMQGLPAGMYLLNISIGNEIAVLRVMKAK